VLDWRDGESWRQTGKNGGILFTGQSPQRAVVLMEEELLIFCTKWKTRTCNKKNSFSFI
jgi:hypothetical protein